MVGWQYQENKAAVKEAKQNLENYLDERKISDLQFAQKKEVELIQKQIDEMNEIQKYINKIDRTTNAQTALMDLMKNGILPPQYNDISSAINYITGAAVKDVNGSVTSLDGHFEEYKTMYETNSIALAGYIDNLEKETKKLSDWISSYESSEKLVKQIAKDFESVVNGPDSKITSLESKISKFLGGKDYSTWLADMEKKFQGAVSAIPQTPVADTSRIEQLITEAKEKLEEIKIELSQIGSLLNSSVLNITQGFTKFGPLEKFDDEYYRKIVDFPNGGDRSLIGKYVRVKDLNLWDQWKETLPAGTRLYSFSSGIEKGPVNYTGLAMLHGSPSNPEFVLNSDQAYTLLRNLSTMTLSPYQAPAVESYNHSNANTTYAFNGPINLPNVKDPSTFFSELLREANTKFGTIKKNY